MKTSWEAKSRDIEDAEIIKVRASFWLLLMKTEKFNKFVLIEIAFLDAH